MRQRIVSAHMRCFQNVHENRLRSERCEMYGGGDRRVETPCGGAWGTYGIQHSSGARDGHAWRCP